MKEVRPDATRAKLAIFVYGMTGFAGSIAAFLVTLALNVPWLLFTDAGPGDRVLLGIGDILNITPFLCMLLVLLSFGGIITSLLMEPRQFNMRSRAAGILPRILALFFSGAFLFVLIITATVTVFLFLSFRDSGKYIQLVIAIIVATIGIGMIKFLAGLAFSMVREELRPRWLKDFLSRLDPSKDARLPERVERPL